MAATVFGARHTFFVTNGTSTANKIVHQALLQPGDVVLIDRNCHKSHHYAMVLCGAQPVYLQTDPVTYEGEFTGICRGVTTAEILRALDEHPDAKMLCLTNCTFDGYVHKVTDIVTAVQEKLASLRREPGGVERTVVPNRFIYFFDEAWFGFARFVNELRPFTAMEVARRHPECRVYATQSTHKTLTAFRQGSMIHVSDPYFERAVATRFAEAHYTHSSTSPNYSILASLDVGRMQADLEGPTLCE
jgi:arginine decarboxylase